MRPIRGFTLIELLVAMAVVAIIGVIAFTGLSNVIEQQSFAAERIERWREVQFAMRVIVQDLSQTHPRVVRDEAGVSFVPSFSADPTKQFALEFSRGGWSNPAGFSRGTVLRVAYDVEEDTLVRFHWPVADRTLATPPVRVELLTGIVAMSVLFIDDSGESHTEWPPVPVGGGRLSSRPRAVEFNIELEDYGEIWRLIETTS
jgi:general secretion pathway protein J